ncbi:MAG: hypothetical protein K2Y22_17570 [Candidatus Obscuribacterales bacterium]|nr:hypothetical protein [Candidatus Obscuribacterales bacterium]
MKNLLKILVCLSVLMVPQASIAEEWHEAIKLNFAIDEKDWELGWSNKSSEVYILEFVPKGQNVENWKELITFEFYPGLQEKINCEEFAAGFIKQIRKKEPNVKVMYYLNKPNDVIVEWVLNGSKEDPDQDEMDRIILGEQGIHMVHYVKKTQFLSEAERTKWLDFLKSATLVKE